MNILSNLSNLFPALDLGAPSDPDVLRVVGYLYGALGFGYVATIVYPLIHSVL